MLIFPMVIGKSLTIPKDLVRAPLAIITINLNDLSILQLSLFKRALVIMLIAASLSTIAICTFPLTLRVTLAAVVVLSSSLSTKLASFSPSLL